MKQQSAPLFSNRVLAGWVAAAAVTIAISFVFVTHSPTSTNTPDPAGPTIYSTSAIGYDVLYHTLDALGVPVRTSGTAPGPNDVLVLAEPGNDPATLEHVRTVLGGAEKIVLILPKRRGLSDPDRPLRLSSDTLLPIDDPLAVLRLADLSATLVRGGRGGWSASAPVTAAPSLGVPQLIASSQVMASLLRTPNGMLVGQLGGFSGRGRYGQKIVVIADPDIVENHGIANGDNALIVSSIIDSLRNGTGSVVFDETIHGFSSSPYSALLLLFKFPFLLITLQLAIATALVIWAGSGRFGAPQPRAPRIAAGKQSLIESGAALLEFAASPAFLTDRYGDAIRFEAAQNFHAPRGLAGSELDRWLSSIGRPTNISPVPARNATEAVAACQALFRWRNETLDEPR